MEISKREQWLRGNMKTAKYAIAGGSFLATAAIGVLKGDPMLDTLRFAFTLAAMAYTTPTFVQTVESVQEDIRKSNNGEMTYAERTPGMIHLVKHTIEPVTDTVKLGKKLFKALTK